MRFYTVLASRPAYYDRNPTSSGQSYNAGSVAPHGVTTRWSFTVPSNRKAFIEAASVLVLQDSLASAASYDLGYVQVQPGGAADIRIVYVNKINVAVGSVLTEAVGSVGECVAGDVVNGITQDANTGGTTAFNISVKYTVFDA